MKKSRKNKTELYGNYMKMKDVKYPIASVRGAAILLDAEIKFIKKDPNYDSNLKYGISAISHCGCVFNEEDEEVNFRSCSHALDVMTCATYSTSTDYCYKHSIADLKSFNQKNYCDPATRIYRFDETTDERQKNMTNEEVIKDFLNRHKYYSNN